MAADREVITAGDVLEIRFPSEEMVGIAYSLEQEAGDSWAYRFLLLAPEGPDQPPTWHAGEIPFEIPDLGIPDPIRVVIPDEAAPGTWRICTAVSQGLCVRIEIVAP